jgi:hypothetical protein
LNDLSQSSYSLFSTWANSDGGTATLTPVPDGGMTADLLGTVLLELQALRRKLLC